MKYNISILIAILLLLLITFTFSFCSNKEKNKSVTPRKTVTKEKKIKPQQKRKNNRSYLTDVNINDFLLDYSKTHKENKVVISTRFGEIKIRLFDDTPLHRANFIYLIKSNFYKDSEFTRVVKDFVIQTGRTDSEEVYQRRRKFGKYTINSEFKPNHFHRKGALAMGRSYDDNPQKKSSMYEFFLVQGTSLTDWDLNAIENSEMIKIPEWKRKVYRKESGIPHLDNEHTVFGQVYKGLNVIDSLAAVKVDKADWPINCEKFTIKVLK